MVRSGTVVSSDTLSSPQSSVVAGQTSAACGSASVQSPGVFLMINSLETGGSERQFSAVANVLLPSAFRVHLGCHVQRGTFVDGFGEIPSFRLGGSLYGWK